ncbi:alpha-L-rhamnosidase [Microbacterium yannicii]|uniref:alpha-L-rhamnosidase n=1 Tax=Microbacterium yannicii TaxID=671622 RepID=UPI00178C6830|nr:alpha-L-rhamnosidase [Microbacterium yannicii]
MTITKGFEVVWNSGRLESAHAIDVVYGGAALESDADYSWTVDAWSTEGEEASASGTFGTSLLRVDDWSARWVVPSQKRVDREIFTIPDIVAGRAVPVGDPSERLHPPRRVRQPFHLRDAPVRARLYATARGIYTAEVNGRAVGEEVLAPGWDAYGSRLSFQCYDVADHLAAGENVVGMTVSDGWFAGRIGITGSSAQYGDELAVIWQLSVEYPDGERQIVVSDAAASMSNSAPWDYADIFIGECFDARRADPGWSEPTREVVGWAPCRDGGDDVTTLVPFAGEPIRRTRDIDGRITHVSPREYLVDLAQVIAGRLRIRVRASSGVRLTLQHGEVLAPDGSFFDNIVGPNKDQTDHYVARGEEVEEYEPTFTFHGFRYASITSDEDFQLYAATGVVLASDLRETLEFHTSDKRINRLHENVVWSQRGNFLSIPTDCPQRERAGWTGDLLVYAPSAATVMDIRPFVERWLANARVDQHPDGRIPPVIPVIPSMHDGGPSDVTAAAGWGDAIVHVPWTLYQRYDDTRVLAENYSAIRRWVDFQQAQALTAVPDRLRDADPERLARHRLMWNTGWQFGDWLAPSIMREGLDPVEMAMPRLRSEIVTAMFHARSTQLAAEVARVLGLDEDFTALATRAARIRRAFVDEYVAEDGTLPIDLQGIYVLAIAFDLIPDERRERAVGHLVRLIQEADHHLDTGFLSTPHLLDVLWEAGERDVARRILWQETTPSWLYAVDRGATTVWESWDAIREDGTPTRSSFNHYAFGCVDDWLVRRIGGIESTAPGYAEVLVAPDVDGPIDHARTRLDTVRGPIEVSWRRHAEAVELRASIPQGCTATMRVGSAVEVVGPGEVARSYPRD